MFRLYRFGGERLSYLKKLVDDNAEQNSLLNAELLYEREKLSRRHAEMSTRAVVMAALGGVILGFVLEKPAGSHIWGESRTIVSVSLLFSMLTLLRFEWRADSLTILHSKLDFQFSVANLHSYNLKLTSELKSQQRSINVREVFSIISIAALALALFQIAWFGSGK
jgi:hypothetical protein